MGDRGRNGRSTLNGWKEIAAFLGKSVRSVQRWERDLGLPVRRINTPEHGQIVYASRSEIEQWRLRMNRRSVSLDEVDAPQPLVQTSASPEAAVDGPPAQGAPSVPDPVPAPARFGLATVLGLVAALLAGVLIGRWSLQVDFAPDRIEYSGTAVTAVTRTGQVVWRHDLGEVVAAPDAPEAAPIVVDLDGDGTAEFIVPVRYGSPAAQPSRSDEVLCLRRDGTLVWRAAPRQPLSQGGRTFDGPWLLRGIVAPGAAAGGRLWAAFSHHTWNPGLVLELSADGREQIRFVQDGWVTSLAFWQTPDGPVLAAGGVHNGEEQPSVSLLDLEAVPAQAPTSPDRRLTCDGCPTGDPAGYFLLPTSEVALARGQPYSRVRQISVTDSGLQISTDDDQVGLISPARRFLGLEYADTYWGAHRVLEQAGKLSHSSEKCPGRSAPREVRAWTPDGGWTTYEVASVASPRDPRF